jgi:hypothetical protein
MLVGRVRTFAANLIGEIRDLCVKVVRYSRGYHLINSKLCKLLLNWLICSAEALVGQYRQLQPFYRSKNLLIAIGDDFFFSEPRDFTENYKNYRILIDYINADPRFKMKASMLYFFQFLIFFRSNFLQ